MKPSVRKGIVVKSQKGRDKGRLFVVLYEMDADFVMICDGKTHPIAHMKKKRRKHLMPLGYELPEIVSLFDKNQLKNSDVNKALTVILSGMS